MQFDMFIIKDKLIKIIQSIAIVAMLGNCSLLWSASFQIKEQSGDIGCSYAGIGARASEPSVGFYNSAGLIHLPNDQMAISSAQALGNIQLSASQATTTFLNGNLGTGQTKPQAKSFVPGLHIAKIINDRWAFGLNVIAPFGFSIEYDSKSIARYMSTKSKLTTIDIAPSVAYRCNDHVSVGIGADLVKVEANLDLALGVIGNPDGIQKNTASAWTKGWHIGMLFDITENMRFGINYRSKLRINAKGSKYQNFSFPTPSITTVGLNSLINLPEVVTFSYYQNIIPNWELLSSLEWTRWTRFRQLLLEYSNGTKTLIEENYKNTWRFAIGTSYQINDIWKLKIGLSIDEAPTKEEFITTRIPDSNRQWLSIGLQYKHKHLTIDAGYAHLFFNSTSINEGAPQSIGGTQSSQKLIGEYSSYADIVGIQLTWNFV